MSASCAAGWGAYLSLLLPNGFHEKASLVKVNVVVSEAEIKATKRTPLAMLPHHCEYPTGWLRATPRIGLTHPFTEAEMVIVRALHMICMVRMGQDQRTREYVARRTQEGKSKREILRCLKRYVAREVYRILVPTVA